MIHVFLSIKGFFASFYFVMFRLCIPGCNVCVLEPWRMMVEWAARLPGKGDLIPVWLGEVGEFL